MRKDLRKNLLIAAHNRWLDQRNEISYDARRPSTQDEHHARIVKRESNKRAGWNEPVGIGITGSRWGARGARPASLEDADVQHGGYLTEEQGHRRMQP